MTATWAEGENLDRVFEVIICVSGALVPLSCDWVEVPQLCKARW
jgi:hypothetical protein